MKDDFVDPKGAAEILGLKEGTLAVWRSKNWNRGPRYKKVGRKVRYRKTDLYEYMDSRTVETVDSYSKKIRPVKSQAKQ